MFLDGLILVCEMYYHQSLLGSFSSTFLVEISKNGHFQINVKFLCPYGLIIPKYIYISILL